MAKRKRKKSTRKTYKLKGQADRAAAPHTNCSWGASSVYKVKGGWRISRRKRRKRKKR